MILLIDNYDSFAYNLFQLIGEVNSDIAVYRNDKIEDPDGIVQDFHLNSSLKDQDTEDQRYQSCIDFKIGSHIIYADQADQSHQDQQRSERKSVAVDPPVVARKEEGSDGRDADGHYAAAQNLAECDERH